MTDKEFDNLIKEALSADSVPQHLNDSLIFALRKKAQQKAKVLKFVKACSSCAAVFICAVTVISYYNTDVPSRTENTPEVKNTVTEKEEEVKREEAPPKTEERVKTENIPSSKAPRQKNEVAQNTPVEKADTAAPVAETAEIAADAALAQEDAITPDVAQEESAPSPIIRSIAPPVLGDLFNDGYDYISAISERINAQIAVMDFPEKINFSEITGNESFSLNDKNVLTIEFAAGTIASEVHGDLFFTVGTVQNGVLE